MLPRATVALALALFTVGAGATVVADDSFPDCEPGQPNLLAGMPVLLCEGEHWDGQNPIGRDAPGGGVGGNRTPTVSDPVHLNAYTDAYRVYANAAVFGVGEVSAFVRTSDGTLALWGRDGTNQVLGGTAVEAVMRNADEVLGRPNPGGDGNAVAWLVVLAYGVAVPGDRPVGEGDCSSPAYESGGCPRDDLALTLVLVP